MKNLEKSIREQLNKLEELIEINEKKEKIKLEKAKLDELLEGITLFYQKENFIYRARK